MTKAELEREIKAAEACHIIRDARGEMPRGPGTWPEREPDDLLGVCLHQNGASNFTNYKGTARYHTTQGNHITKSGRPLPTICYDIVIPDLDGPALLVSDLCERKYAQGDSESPGDENQHLISILVMGSYHGPSFNGERETPSPRQMCALMLVLAWLKQVFKFGGEGVFGHCHFGKLDCPGFWGMTLITHERSAGLCLPTIQAWQQALLLWHPYCLPKYGVDGSWGPESRQAVMLFQEQHGLDVTRSRDPFTELKLMRVVKWTHEQMNAL